MKIYCCDTECKNKPKGICVCTALMDVTECPKRIKFKNKITSRQKMIEKILKSDPPYDENDPYYFRDNWQKYGGISSGICMCWGWFRSVRELPDEELVELYNKVITE